MIKLKTTFLFCSFRDWGIGMFDLATKNKGTTSLMSLVATSSIVVPSTLTSQTFFGTSLLVLIMVHATIFANALFGIIKNNRKAAIFFSKAQKFELGTKKHRLNIWRWKKHKFDFKKLYFVFFKSFSFLAYLTMVKALTSDYPDGGEWVIKALSITTEILIRLPIFLFWYYEYKSVGDNTEYIFGKKASIFTILEKLVEPKLSKMYGNKTPTDGDDDKTDFKNS